MPVRTITRPGDVYTQSLLAVDVWDAQELTFSFPLFSQWSGYPSNFSTVGVLLETQREAVREILGLVASYTNLTFVELTGDQAGDAILRFGNDHDAETSYAFLPSDDELGGDGWIAYSPEAQEPEPRDYYYFTILHEFGHMLGLGHPHEAEVGENMPADHDWIGYTVMSYRSEAGADIGYTNSNHWYPQTYMIEDIAALQYAYGANFTTNSGDTIYTIKPQYFEIDGVDQGLWGSRFFSIWDGGGVDTYDFSSFSAFGEVVRTITLQPGEFSLETLANPYLFEDDPRSLIENVIGTGGSDLVLGNLLDNVLDGDDGDDEIYGYEGHDHLIGGSGEDRLYGGDGDDILDGWVFDDQLFGEAGNDILIAGPGDDWLDGGSHVDTVILDWPSTFFQITQIELGVFEFESVYDLNTLVGIEYVEFNNGVTMRLLSGTGTSVNFETTDPSVYQDAMNAIRDFDGNALGGDGSWLRIGSADIDGDGDIDQVLVNDAIGRFATVGGSPDGLSYFDDHGWAGETRVVGIYIDPLVASGDVVAGSDNDSQQRFQNDLFIENINRVLGADDYDGDGLQEVYFALTDGTAYLHAYMHADGNIRYANYQSEAQVIEFLESNGFGAETYGGWFA